MAVTNHERVGKALALLSDGLAPFVARECRAKYGDGWVIATSRVDAGTAQSSKKVSVTDAQFLLKVVWEEWQTVFRNVLGQGPMMRRLGSLSLIAVLTAGLVAMTVGPTGAARDISSARGHPAAAPAYPTSMAALGDSITQAYDSLGRRQKLTSEPQFSWATGYANSHTVDSQYLRLLAVDPTIKGNEHDDSVVGANVSGLLAQVNLAIGQNAQYVVILIGANDVCTETIAGMTPVSTFAETFRTDLATLMKDLPNAHVFVSSIPNLFQLWSILHNNSSAEGIWSFSICQSMFAKSNTSADRALVLEREEADNGALATACKKHANCRWDNLAVFKLKFTPNEVNDFDYFHPSLIGQNRLASITWAVSWWPEAK